jgi:hypothetical protein
MGFVVSAMCRTDQKIPLSGKEVSHIPIKLNRHMRALIDVSISHPIKPDRESGHAFPKLRQIKAHTIALFKQLFTFTNNALMRHIYMLVFSQALNSLN